MAVAAISATVVVFGWLSVLATAGGSTLVQASARFQRLGDFRVTSNPTYAGAKRSFGPATSCRLVRTRLGVDASHAVADWKRLGVQVNLRTYGGLPAGKTGCTARAAIHVSTIRVIGAQWRTSPGLRVGDSTVALLRAYPHAKKTGGSPGWYRSGFWLVTR